MRNPREDESLLCRFDATPLCVPAGLRDESGSFLTGFVSGGRDFVVGEAGRRYTIVLKNMTGQRFECVVSVDGLDVLDGKDASFQKRGYLLDPHAELEVDGFRQSVDAVAAFRFGISGNRKLDEVVASGAK